MSTYVYIKKSRIVRKSSREDILQVSVLVSASLDVETYLPCEK